VTDSVCAYLGHPRHCPHGRPIPRGACCARAERVLEPLVRPLTNLDAGDEARIVYIVPTDSDQLVRLSNLGIVPGATVRLQQRRPAYVLTLGETSLALDTEVGREIYVRKVENEE
jgi:DtxR family Mn-dependent transcriptional regulator